MATYRKRGSAWRVEVCVNGVRESATRDTKAEAKEWAARRETEIRAGKLFKGSGKTLRDAFARYAEEVTPTKKGARWELIRINKMARAMSDFVDKPLPELSPDDFTRWRDAELKRIAPASVRRELNIVAAVIDVARREWKWIERSPLTDIRKPLKSKARDRLISQAEVDLMCGALGYAEWLPIAEKRQQVAIAFLLALETAMRASEIYGLTWDRVNVRRRFLSLADTKNGDARDVPLSSRALALLERLRGLDAVTVFTVDGATASTLFRKARDRIGIEDLHFHDTRHEAITRLSKLLGVLELARMVGHRDPRSLMTYYNETAEELARKLG